MPPTDRSSMRRLADAVTGPRGRWVAIAVWLAIGVAGLFAHARIGEVTAAGQSSFLPSNAESTRAIDALEGRGGGDGGGGGFGEEVPVVIVFERDGGLSEADLSAIGRIGDGLNGLAITGATPIIDPFSADATESLGEVATDRQGGRAALARRRSGAGRGGAERRRPRRDRRRGAADPPLPRRPQPQGRQLLRDRAGRDRRRPRAGRRRSRRDAADRDPRAWSCCCCWSSTGRRCWRCCRCSRSAPPTWSRSGSPTC